MCTAVQVRYKEAVVALSEVCPGIFCRKWGNITISFDVSLTVQLSIILVMNQLNAQNHVL